MFRRLLALFGRSGADFSDSWAFRLGGSSQPLPVCVHPARSGRVVVMLPGWDGSIDGYQDKYRRIAERVRASCGVAVVRADNHVVPGFDFEGTCQARLRGLLEQVLAHGRRVCGAAQPEVWLLGFSAGASAMAAVAADYPAVTRMLLVAPSSDAGYDDVVAGLRRFGGTLHVVVGANDLVVSDLPQSLAREATSAARVELAVVPDCDHQFRGAANGRILSQAPLWAFLGVEGFPDPQQGIHLYD